jgi:hypothetical protein
VTVAGYAAQRRFTGDHGIGTVQGWLTDILDGFAFVRDEKPGTDRGRRELAEAEDDSVAAARLLRVLIEDELKLAIARADATLAKNWGRVEHVAQRLERDGRLGDGDGA